LAVQTTGDQETDERARRGQRPDVQRWKAIAELLDVSERTARAWERDGMPVISWGAKYVAGYSDRLLAWAFTRRGAAA
jgi:phage terminase Nu1 subunit (DNA packaging protein)